MAPRDTNIGSPHTRSDHLMISRVQQAFPQHLLAVRVPATKAKDDRLTQLSLSSRRFLSVRFNLSHQSEHLRIDLKSQNLRLDYFREIQPWSSSSATHRLSPSPRPGITAQGRVSWKMLSQNLSVDTHNDSALLRRRFFGKCGDSCGDRFLKKHGW